MRWCGGANGAVFVAVVVAFAGSAWAEPVARGALEPDETIKEVMLSLDASSVEKVPLDRYALFALDALADLDRCLARHVEGGVLSVACQGSVLKAPWPPARAIDVARLLSDAARLVDPERVIRPVRIVAICRALAKATDDPFTAYLSPTTMENAQRSGAAAATPGLDLWPREPSRIREVRLGSDAANQGIRSGDRILSIDGLEVSELTFPEVLQALSGASGTVVRLVVQSSVAGPPRTVMVRRFLVQDDDIRWTRLQGGQTLYVHIPVFQAGVVDRVRQVLSAGAYTGVVLDLRHNPGGLLPEGIGLLDTFLREGLMAGVRSGPGRPTDDFVAHKDAFDSMVPLVVIIDGGSASASELVAKVLKERGRATVIGTTSAGKGSVQRQIPTPDGGLLKVTAGAYVGPTGTRLDEWGVRPHRFLAPSSRKTALEGANPAEDSWVLSALDALQGVERNAMLSVGAGPRP
jgi:carboxyl-terminal processing protease